MQRLTAYTHILGTAGLRYSMSIGESSACSWLSQKTLETPSCKHDAPKPEPAMAGQGSTREASEALHLDGDMWPVRDTHASSVPTLESSLALGKQLPYQQIQDKAHRWCLDAASVHSWALSHPLYISGASQLPLN